MPPWCQHLTHFCNPCYSHHPEGKTLICQFCFKTVPWSALWFTNWFWLWGPSHPNTPDWSHIDSHSRFLLVISIYQYSKPYTERNLPCLYSHLELPLTENHCHAGHKFKYLNGSLIKTLHPFNKTAAVSSQPRPVTSLIWAFTLTSSSRH